MIHIEQAIIVEGKYDKIKLSSIIDGVIIVTDGFGIFKNREKLELIRRFAEATGVIILTDSDTAGFRIRNFLKGSIPDGKITNVYIPDIYGKEKRKIKPSAEGKLGVEGVEREVILTALQNAGVIFSDHAPPDTITRADLYDDGFIGKEKSAILREMLLKELGLPEHMSVTGLLEVINTMPDNAGYREAAARVRDNINRR